MSQHWYVDGQLVPAGTPGALPSVSTILETYNNKELHKWREMYIDTFDAEALWNRMSDASEKGTRVHQVLEDLMLEGDSVCDEEDLPYIQGFVNWYEKQDDFQLAMTELYVESKKYKYAGRLDLLAYLGKDLYIIDYKTSKQHSVMHGLQLAAYRQALKEQTGLTAKTAVLKLTDKTQKGWQWREYKEPLAPFLGLKRFFDWDKRKHPAKEPWLGGVIRREK